MNLRITMLIRNKDDIEFPCFFGHSVYVDRALKETLSRGVDINYDDLKETLSQGVDINYDNLKETLSRRVDINYDNLKETLSRRVDINYDNF